MRYAIVIEKAEGNYSASTFLIYLVVSLPAQRSRKRKNPFVKPLSFTWTECAKTVRPFHHRLAMWSMSRWLPSLHCSRPWLTMPSIMRSDVK